MPREFRPTLGAASRAVRQAAVDALAVLSPVECAGCGAPDRSLCPACLEAVRPHAVTSRLPGGLPVTSALRYEGAAREAILALKEQGRTDVARALRRSMAAAVAAARTAVLSDAAEAASPPLELLAAPRGPAAYRRRGYDPVMLLLGRAAPRHASRILVRTRSTDRQKSLGADARRANVEGSVRASRDLAGRRFLIVDDVVTTGATLLEIERAIVAAGGVVLAAATLAFTPKLFAEFTACPPRIGPDLGADS